MSSLPRPLRAWFCLALAGAGPFGIAARAASPLDATLDAVVKIHVTIQRPDYAQPWQAITPGSVSGSGFVIARRRILTNAHVVSDATFLEIQRHRQARKVPARVAFAGHDCDLAILEVEDEHFLDGIQPLEFSSELPTLGQEVHAVGYPMGGQALSLTRGVVSRIDHNVYEHSGVDVHLVMQTDAAINPGNSGGPVVFGGRVVGVAFQGLMAGQNIGYAIPLPVVRHFLDDIEDGTYHGYPELGLTTFDTRNPALRRALGLTQPDAGSLAIYVDPYGAARGRLAAGDVLLSVDGYPVAPDGTVRLEQGTLNFGELVERRQWGERMTFEIRRTGTVQRVEVPLDNRFDPFQYRHEYDRPPEYVAVGGLVFVPLSRNFLTTLDGKDDTAVQGAFYRASRAKPDGLAADRTQFVLLGARLPHAANAYAQGYMYQFVDEVNGRCVQRLADVAAALEQPTNGFHVVRFDGHPLPLVLDAAAAGRADAEIAIRYGLTRRVCLRGEDAP